MLDVVYDSLDPNGFPINPRWAAQDTSHPRHRRYPVVEKECGNFAVWQNRGPGFLKDCTAQISAITFTRAPWYVPTGICPFHDSRPNHVNWRVGNGKPERAASVAVGRIYYGDLSFDGDLDLFLRTPGDPGRTWGDRRVTNPSDTSEGHRLTEVEFHVREVQRHMSRKGGWWGRLAGELVDAEREREERNPAEVLNGLAAVVTGIFGVDGVHASHSEIHPVFAMAVRFQTDSLHDRWAVFARNWGSEGMCSSRNETLDLPDNRITVWIPWRRGATGADVRWDGKAVVASTDSPVIVRIPLRRPSQHMVAEGELHITWRGPVARDTLRRDSALAWEELKNPEELAEQEYERLRPAQREAVDAEVAIYERTETARARRNSQNKVGDDEEHRIEVGADSVRLAGICRRSARMREAGACTGTRRSQ